MKIRKQRALQPKNTLEHAQKNPETVYLPGLTATATTAHTGCRRGR